MRHGNKYPSWQLRHEAVLRWIFEHPAATQKDCAKTLGYSVSHISRIVNSPEFRIRFSQLTDKELLEIIQHRVLGK